MRRLLVAAAAVLLVAAPAAQADELDRAREFVSWVSPAPLPCGALKIVWAPREITDALAAAGHPDALAYAQVDGSCTVGLVRSRWARETDFMKCRAMAHEIGHLRRGDAWHSFNPRSVMAAVLSNHPFRPCDVKLREQNRRVTARWRAEYQ